MVLRLLVILVVSFVFISVEVGAAKKNNKKKRNADVNLQPSCTFHCGAAAKEIDCCLTEKSGKKYYENYWTYSTFYNTEKMTKIIEKLIEKKCIRKKYADDVRCYIKFKTPPDFYIKIYAELPKEETKALKNYELNPNCTECMTAAFQVYDKIYGGIDNWTDVERTEFSQWNEGFENACLDLEAYYKWIEKHYPLE